MTRKSSHRVPPDIAATMVRMRRQGWSYNSIGDRTGYTISTVIRHVWKVLGKTPRSNSQRIEEAETLVAEGKPVIWVAEYLGYDINTLKRMLRDRRAKRERAERGEPEPPNGPKARKSRLPEALAMAQEGKSCTEICHSLGYKNRGSARASIRKHLAKRHIRWIEGHGFRPIAADNSTSRTRARTT